MSSKRITPEERAILQAVKWGHLTPNEAANKLKNLKGS